MKRFSRLTILLACFGALVVNDSGIASDLDRSSVMTTHQHSVFHEYYPAVSLSPELIQQTLKQYGEERRKIENAEMQRKKNLRRFYIKLLAVVSAQ